MKNQPELKTDASHDSQVPAQISHLVRALIAGLALLLGTSSIAPAAVVADIAKTNHNLSVTGPGTVKATSETQICVFCHTPHSATPGMVAPLWNRTLSTATYTPYTSSSLEANAAELAAAPGGTSKLCLSCHDGTLAMGTVNVLNGASPGNIAMAGTDAGTKMAAAGITTGYTRNLGVDLTNDHPISFTYNDTLATNDGELRAITGNTDVKNRLASVNPKPKFPLENDQVQCATCHDPHLYDNAQATNGNLKFLRGNRFQQVGPSGGAYSAANDIMCLACHDKGAASWSNSAHANPLVGDETYDAAAANQREFPAGTPVWKAACLNCHDTHTVQGARHLQREGTDSVASPKQGGASAIEETCYQCHRASGAGNALNVASYNPAGAVPNIKGEFTTSLYYMPIATATEVHEIGTTGTAASTHQDGAGKDLRESQYALGLNNNSNRHAECPDCHNPHRIVKNQLFIGNAGNTATPDAAATHKHTDADGYIHDNIAPGALRGSFGVEPNYPNNSFQTAIPSNSYTEKFGDPGGSASTLVSASYVTREYQICLKCHSSYAFGSNPPLLGGTGRTPAVNNGMGLTNGITQYTDQAKEFNAPTSHKGEVTAGVDGGASAGVSPRDYNINNHRSWHPVMGPTGRDAATRKGTGNVWTTTQINDAFLPPWNNTGALGNQTMYCGDCHGDATGSLESVIPQGGVNGDPWGPHGSSNPFLLKGKWKPGVTTASDPTNAYAELCFKCHNARTYRNYPTATGYYGTTTKPAGGTGFCCVDNFNLHYVAAGDLSKHGTDRGCTNCHVAVPHGWKNKAFLVNLNDVGPEVGLPPGTIVGDNYTNPPYYYNARLRVKTFKKSGSWVMSDCDTSCGINH